MTKKEQILEVFNAEEWIDHGPDRVKIFSQEQFRHIGYLSCGYGEDDSFCKYVSSIIRGMGHTVAFGMCMNVYENRLKKKREEVKVRSLRNSTRIGKAEVKNKSLLEN